MELILNSNELLLVNGGGASLGTAVAFCGGVACVVWSPIILGAAGVGAAITVAGSGLVAIGTSRH